MTKENAHTHNVVRYEEARALVIQEQVASATFLHSRMGIGYPKALMILNLLEQRGIISPDSGNAPRQVLIKT